MVATVEKRKLQSNQPKQTKRKTKLIPVFRLPSGASPYGTGPSLSDREVDALDLLAKVCGDKVVKCDWSERDTMRVLADFSYK